VKPGFVRDALSMYESAENFNHQGVIPHLKVCIVTDKTYTIDDDTIIYLGSHNFTPSAWGKVEKNDSVLSITNTELGVVFPPLPGSAARKQQIVKDLPFKFPPRKFPTDKLPFFNTFFSANE
jgi:tyrosyl-DNA phosphodiesterase 1